MPVNKRCYTIAAERNATPHLLGVVGHLGQPAAQPRAIHQLEDQPHALCGLEELVQRDDVLVAHTFHDLNLRVHRLGVVHLAVLLDHLACEFLASHAVVHQVHFAGRTIPQHTLKVVVFGHQIRRDAVLNVNLAAGQLRDQLLVRAIAQRPSQCFFVVVVQRTNLRMHLHSREMDAV